MILQLVLYTASCGAVSATGMYTAPPSGTCRVIATAPPFADTATVTVAQAGTTTAGVPFGPFGLWTSPTTVAWGPAPFTASIAPNQPSGVVAQIQAARTMGQRLVLFLAGGDHEQYKTNGAFDPAKWRTRVALYNTLAIRTAIAGAVADGTVIGNAIIDEPENADWGGVVTKPMLDQLAAYAKGIFPTLPMGVNHGSNQQGWRATERFTVVDYVNYQYRADAGDPAIYRTKVLAQSALDGVATSFSLNLLAGGQPDRDGVYDCAGLGQYGLGVWAPLCRMTPSQVTAFGRALGDGCALLLWKYDAEYFGLAGVPAALHDVATALAATPRRACRRTP